jgi:hypothetical protein
LERHKQNPLCDKDKESISAVVNEIDVDTDDEIGLKHEV